jgi:tRNA pseudouridine32 synthase/23S rRNA pseudouridine746 synthase
LFQERQIGKRYHVCVHGETPLALKLDSNIDGREARTICTRLGYDDENDRSVLDVEIDTGRKHQIRRHLAEAGFPVVGDRLYGLTGDTEDLMLVASRITVPLADPGVVRQYELPGPLSPILKDCE